MLSLVVTVALVAAFVGVLAVSRIFAFRHAVARAAHALSVPFVALVVGVSAVADFCLSPRGPRGIIAPWRFALWLLVCAAPLLAWQGVTRLALSPPAWADPGYLLIVGAAFAALLLAAWCLIAFDDLNVMDGVVQVGVRRFSGRRVASRATVAVIAGAAFVVYAAAIAYWLMDERGVALVAAGSGTGNAVIDSVLVALSALPTRFVLVAVDRLAGDSTAAVFQSHAIAQVYALGFELAGALLVIAVATTLVLRRWRLNAFVAEIARSRDDDYTFLVVNARRAPDVVKRGLLGAALYERDPVRQRRLLDAARDMTIHAFPQAFCRRLESFTPEVQQAGLDRATELYRERAVEFDARLSAAILRRTAEALSRARLDAEPLKRLLRLMLTVVTSKKPPLKIEGRERDFISAAIKAELARPRAEGDAALRGYLRELQAVLGMPLGNGPAKQPAVGKKITPIKLEDAPSMSAAMRLQPKPAPRPISIKLPSETKPLTLPTPTVTPSRSARSLPN